MSKPRGKLVSGRNFIGLVVLAVDFLVLVSRPTVFLWLVAIVIGGCYEIYRLFHKKLSKREMVEKESLIQLSMILYGLTIFSYYALYLQPDGKVLCLQAILAIRTFDVFAYWGGSSAYRNLGNTHKIWPTVSKGKSWEGAISGWIAGILSVLASAWVLRCSGIQPALTFEDLPLMAMVLPLGHLGDFAESVFKRWKVDVKDSGNLLGEHGGILDRFDSFVVVSVVMLIFRLAGLV